MSSHIFQNKKLLKNRRKLRSNETETEKILWNKLRSRRLGGYKFTRQYSVGPYIIDFYCPQCRFGVELDGSQHDEEDNRIYD